MHVSACLFRHLNIFQETECQININASNQLGEDFEMYLDFQIAFSDLRSFV